MDELRPLFLDRLRRALEQDREGRRVSEVLLEHLVGTVRVRARHVERRRVQLPLDVTADPTQADDQPEGDQQNRARAPKRKRQPSLAAASHWPCALPPTLRGRLEEENAFFSGLVELM